MLGALLGLFPLVAQVLPAHADEPLVDPLNAGGGTLQGTIAYTSAPLPAVGAPCRATTFRLEAASIGVGASSVISGYAGPIALAGTAASPCEDMRLGDGTLTVALTGRNDLGSEIECATLTGRFARTLTDLTVQVSGSCTVNQHGAGVVILAGRLQLVPNGTGAGVLTAMASASAFGTFAVAPH